MATSDDDSALRDDTDSPVGGQETLDGDELDVTLPALRPSARGRYVLGRELGRGGLGKVIEALDRDFGRSVALKTMHASFATNGSVGRFLLEGRVAGRLTHPNIVSIHEVGLLQDDEGAVPYFTMDKIVGRDLSVILGRLRDGDPRVRAAFPRPRLLRLFLDVCNAMAYAHDHGVVHRDLKPANVMVGDYGEVFVVDWGLAKALGDKDGEGRRPKGEEGRETGEGGRETGEGRGEQGGESGDTGLTVEGQILGTPSYMPPEQAEGRVEAMDAQSDVYSLGAILYEILTLRPPFQGQTVVNILSKVLTEAPAAPSSVAPASAGTDGVPPELDEVVLRALAKHREERYSSARELAAEIQLYLEGEKQRAYNREQAADRIGLGRDHVEELAFWRAELVQAVEEVAEKEKEVKPSWPAERKRSLWELQERVENLKYEVVEAFTEAANMFQEALTFERDNREARAALADLYWDQFLRQEEAGDAGEMLHYEKMVRRYNDGQYDERLRGDGTLSVETAAYPCSCMARGRSVAPEELSVLGYHPLSGRKEGGGKETEGLPALEPRSPLTLRVHGAECRTVPAPGADAWLFRYREREKRLVLAEPAGVTSPADRHRPPPSDLLDRAFPSEAGVPSGQGLYLGTTPLGPLGLPMGSYLLLLHREGCLPVRVPVAVERNAHREVAVTLFGEDDVPPGFVHVPAGPFLFQGDGGNPYSGPREVPTLGDFFMARFPVTCREYVAFLDHLDGLDPEAARGHVPREAEQAGHYWPRRAEGGYAVPTASWLAAAPEEVRRTARRLDQAPVDWEEGWPVLGVSWQDMMSYAAHRTAETGWLQTLPHEMQWEKSARGTDGRVFPWGRHEDATFCNQNRTLEHGMRPCPVESFPVDESPYGVRGLGGNARDVVMNDPGKTFPAFRLFRGGAWRNAGIDLRATVRAAALPTNVNNHLGGRLVCLPLLPSPKK